MKLRRSGDVKSEDVVKAFEQFEEKTSKKHGISILVIVVMSHGLENDW